MRRTHRTTVVIATITFLVQSAGGARADEPSCPPYSVAVDDRIRVVSPGLGTWPVSGRLAAVDDEALSMTRPDRPELLRVPWCSISRLEVSRGTRRQTGKGARVGFFVLGIPFALFAVVAVAAGDIDCEHSCRGLSGMAAGAGVGAAVGTGIGAAIGTVGRTDRWETAPSRQVRVIVKPQRDGLAAGLAVSF